MFASNGILFNHESERRGETFVTRKITRALARDPRSACRTSSTSATSTPSATGATRRTTPTRCGGCSSRTSPTTTSSPPARCTRCASSSTRPPRTSGSTGRTHVEIDPRYFRPAEVDALCGDASKAREKLGWEPKVTFKELVRIMVDADVKALEDQLAGRGVRTGERG